MGHGSGARAIVIRMRRTKIVCTLGPASLQAETIAAMIRAGMDVVRLNTSHGSIAEHVRSVALVREVADREGKPIGVLMDLGGPKLRTGVTADGSPLVLARDDHVFVTGISTAPAPGVLTINYPHLTTDVAPGERVLIDDGNVELVVESVGAGGLECRVIHGPSGQGLKPGRGVTFPSSNLTMKALTERDREAIAAGVAAGVDIFALSFVADANDIIETRDYIASFGADIPIVAKIERRRAIENLDEILAEADGAMVARGDLGVELAPEDVPVQQRRIIASAGRNMIPVITATQMLESMVTSPRPTRAESSDVANAVWDLSDALMLSEETAVGLFPVESVAMMDRIIRRAEDFASPDIPRRQTPMGTTTRTSSRSPPAASSNPTRT